jgi:hypothetical protein
MLTTPNNPQFWCDYCSATGASRCPRCGSASIVPLLFGLPSSDAVNRAESGEFALGGCVVGFGDPGTACRTCDHRWTTPTSPFAYDTGTITLRWDTVEWIDQITDALAEFTPVFDPETIASIDDINGNTQLANLLYDTDPASWARSLVQVACSDSCRDALIAEGAAAPVSVWHESSDGYHMVAGIGPYRYVPSVAVTAATLPLGKNLEPSTHLIIAVSLLINNDTITDLRTILGDPHIGSPFTTHLNAIIDHHLTPRPPQPQPHNPLERHHVDVDTIIDGRTVTVAVVATDRPIPHRVTLKEAAHLSASMVAERLAPGTSIMSHAQAESALRRGKRTIKRLTPAQTCAHAHLTGSRCSTCGTAYQPRAQQPQSADLTPRDVLHRGTAHTYQWYTPDQRRVAQYGRPLDPEGLGTGTEFLRDHLHVDAAPNPEPYSSETTGPKDPKPLVAGYFGGYGVILFEDEAQRLAEIYNLAVSHATYRELLGTAAAYGYTWVNDIIDQWRENEATDSDAGGAPPPIDPSAPVDIPAHGWVSDDDTGIQWPYIDSDPYTDEANTQVAQWLGRELDDYEIDYEFGVRIHDHQLESLVASLELAGAPIRIDQQLINQAAGFHT